MTMTTTNTFTERQRQVVTLIAQGHSNETAGQRLGIATRTVKMHTDLLRHKLGVTRRRMIPQAFARVTGENPFAAAEIPETVAA